MVNFQAIHRAPEAISEPSGCKLNWNGSPGVDHFSATPISRLPTGHILRGGSCH